MQGKQIPLLEVATIKTNSGIGSIGHRDSDRVVTVEAKPAQGFFAAERLSAIEKKLDIGLPESYGRKEFSETCNIAFHHIFDKYFWLLPICRRVHYAHV